MILTKKQFIDAHKEFPDDALIEVILVSSKGKRLNMVQCDIANVCYHAANRIQIDVQLPDIAESNYICKKLHELIEAELGK